MGKITVEPDFTGQAAKCLDLMLEQSRARRCSIGFSCEIAEASAILFRESAQTYEFLTREVRPQFLHTSSQLSFVVFRPVRTNKKQLN
jgi:hypothetical protein